MTTYAGYTETEQQAKARWQLMQKRAELATRQTAAAVTDLKAAVNAAQLDRLLFALAQEKMYQGG